MNRKKGFELSIVFVSLIILGVSINVVGRGADELWLRNTGVLHALASAAAVPVADNLDIPVAFVVGLMGGLFCLFFIDGTKRVQAGFVLVFGGLFSFLPLIMETGRILDTVGRQPIAFVAGLLFGLSGGLIFALHRSNLYPLELGGRVGVRERLRWVQFPTATRGFLWGSSALVIVTGVDYALTASPLVMRLKSLLAAIGFVFSLIVFTQYEYQRDIVTLSPPNQATGKYHPYVIGGLYELAKDDYYALPWTGEADQKLARVQGPHIQETSDLPDQIGVDISFGYLWPTFGGLSARKIVVESESRTTDDLPPNVNQYNRADIGVGSAFRIAGWVRRYLRFVAPSVVSFFERFVGREHDVLDRLDHADTALLLAPTPSSDDDLPPDIGVYRDLCERYDDPLSTDVVIATTDAMPVADELGESGRDLDATRLVSVCKNRLGVSNCTLIPLDRFATNGSGGFDDLLKTLSK